MAQTADSSVNISSSCSQGQYDRFCSSFCCNFCFIQPICHHNCTPPCPLLKIDWIEKICLQTHNRTSIIISFLHKSLQIICIVVFIHDFTKNLNFKFTEIELEGGVGGPSWVPKPFHVPRFLFVGKKAFSYTFPEFQRADSSSY